LSLLSTVVVESIKEAEDIKHLKSRGDTKPCPDMLIICLVQGGEDVVSRVAEIKAFEPTARIVFVAPKLDLHVMSACFAAGASGYLLDRISGDALRESLKLVTAGEKVFPSELVSLFPMLTSNVGSSATSSGDALREGPKLLTAGQKVFPSEVTSPFPMLTSKVASPETSNFEPSESDLSRREIEILRCLTDGQSNKVIAKNLDIAEATVKVHIKHILRKAHVVNRTQAALWGVAAGVTSAPASRKVAS
jgi:two-component system, NarL family, nitrate/nitrite response regulator NarL